MDANLNHFLTVKDHSVSGETFELYKDESLDLLLTHPKPALSALGKYYESEDYISHTDSKRGLFEKLYHFVKAIALKNKVKLIGSQANFGNLLDIGAGTGDFLATAKASSWNTTGVEPSEKARKIASKKGLILAESSKDLPDHSFDVITMWHVLEHVPDVSWQINELKRLLKPDGAVVIAVPNFNSYDAKHYGSFWAAYDVPRHLSHFSKMAIEKLFAQSKMELVKILPMPFDAFYVSLLSEKYKTGKMNYAKAFSVGWKSNRYGKQKMEYSSHIYILKNAKTKNKA